MLPRLVADRNESVPLKDDKTMLNSEALEKTAFVIPVRDQIGSPILDILRRGMKQAIATDVDLVILDMDTLEVSLCHFRNYAGNFRFC